MKAAWLQVSISLTGRSRKPGLAHFSLNWRNFTELSVFISTLNGAGVGPQMLREIQCFSGLPTHSCPFLLQDVCSLHHPRGTFISEWSAASPKTLKGCFVSLSPQTPWTRRLPSSHRYLFTVAYICMSLSQPPAVTAGKRAVRSELLPGPGSGSPQFITIITLLTLFVFQVLFNYCSSVDRWLSRSYGNLLCLEKVGILSCQ